MQIQLNRVRFANTLILGGMPYVMALLIYAAIRGSSGYYLVIGTVVLLFLVISIRLPEGLKLNITVVLLSTGSTIFLLRRTVIDILKLRNLRTFALGRLALSRGEALEPIGEEELELYSRVLRDGRDHVAAWGGTSYLVYIPIWVRYGNPDDTPGIDHGPQLELIQFYDRVLSIAENLGIRTIDVKKEVDSHPDPLSLWPYRLTGHFNEAGHKFLADKVLENIEMGG